MYAYKLVVKQGNNRVSFSSGSSTVNIESKNVVKYKKDVWVGPRCNHKDSYLFVFKDEKSAIYYGKITFWSAYAKAHFPTLFITSYLSNDFATDTYRCELWRCEVSGVVKKVPFFRIRYTYRDNFWENLKKCKSSKKRITYPRILLSSYVTMPAGTMFAKKVKLVEFIKSI